MKPEKPKNLGFKQIYFNLDKILFLFFLTFMMIELSGYHQILGLLDFYSVRQAISFFPTTIFLPL